MKGSVGVGLDAGAAGAGDPGEDIYPWPGAHSHNVSG